MDKVRVANLCLSLGAEHTVEEGFSDSRDRYETESFLVTMSQSDHFETCEIISFIDMPRRIAHAGETDMACEHIEQMHKLYLERLARHQSHVTDICKYMLDKGVPVTLDCPSGVYTRFMVGDVMLFSADYIGTTTFLNIGAPYPCNKLIDFIALLEDDSNNNVYHPVDENTLVMMGDIALAVPLIVQYGATSVVAKEASQMLRSTDAWLDILLGNVQPKKVTYYAITFKNAHGVE